MTSHKLKKMPDRKDIPFSESRSATGANKTKNKTKQNNISITVYGSYLLVLLVADALRYSTGQPCEIHQQR
jgi:hypothetical protein